MLAAQATHDHYAARVHAGEQAMAFLEQSRLARATARRRVRFGSSAITAGIAIVAAIALWQWYQAAKERGHAQEGYAAASLIVGNMFNTMHLLRLGVSVEASVADQIIQGYSEVIALDPNNTKTASAYSGRGNAYTARGDYDRAIADLNRAIALDQKYDYAYDNRGYTYYLKGEYDRAIADLDQAIDLGPHREFPLPLPHLRPQGGIRPRD
jgi:tetratricopeptide (TPR) repeat protein